VRLRTTAAVLGLFAVAGCSPVVGTPSPSTTAPTSSAPAVPKVAHPLDTTKYQAAPCTLLTAAQVTPYGITKPGYVSGGTTALGPGCRWSTTSSLIQGFNVQFITANTSGLTTLYINRDVIVQGGGYFEATTVQGYPAVFNSQADQRKTGKCSLAVGVTDTLTYNVAIGLDPASPEYTTSCDPAAKIADMVMTTLRGGA
jgi:Protein of unknown function (DUF3558)